MEQPRGRRPEQRTCKRAPPAGSGDEHIRVLPMRGIQQRGPRRGRWGDGDALGVKTERPRLFDGLLRRLFGLAPSLGAELADRVLNRDRRPARKHRKRRPGVDGRFGRHRRDARVPVAEEARGHAHSGCRAR
jgi:hypothetical protein